MMIMMICLASAFTCKCNYEMWSIQLNAMYMHKNMALLPYVHFKPYSIVLKGCKTRYGLISNTVADLFSSRT